jgi:hypothetical protein
VASPLFEEWHRFLGSPLSTIMTKNLTSNQVTGGIKNDRLKTKRHAVTVTCRYQICFALFSLIQARWDLLVQQEGPAGMAESVISQTSTSSSSGAGSIHCDSRLEGKHKLKFSHVLYLNI